MYNGFVRLSGHDVPVGASSSGSHSTCHDDKWNQGFRGGKVNLEVVQY